MKRERERKRCRRETRNSREEVIDAMLLLYCVCLFEGGRVSRSKDESGSRLKKIGGLWWEIGEREGRKLDDDVNCCRT